MAQRGRPPKARSNPNTEVDMSLLTEEARQRILDDVQKDVQEEAIAAAEEAFREEALTKARRRKGLDEEMVQVRIDLPEYADRLTIDGRIYMHNGTYTLPKSAADGVAEMQSRAWGHQREIEGKPRFNPRPNNARISPAGVVNSSNLVRV